MFFFFSFFLIAWQVFYAIFCSCSIREVGNKHLCEIVVGMGGCVSKSNKRIRTTRRKCRTSGKRRGRISASIPEFVHLGFEKGAAATSTTTCKRSEVSNMTFHLTQLQWNHSQADSNGGKNFKRFLFFLELMGALEF